MKRKLLILTSLICFCGISIYLSCGRDCPVCPKEEEPPPLGHYRLYVWDGYNNLLMSIDTPVDTIVDSIRFDYLAGGISVTPDGNRLLVKRYDYDSSFGWMEIYSASDFSHLGSVYQYGEYHFDGGDNYGIWKTREKVYFINPHDLSPIDSISFDLPAGVSIGHSYLDTTSNQFFCRTEPFFASDSASRIYQIDCKSRNLVDSVITPLIWGRTISLAYNWFTNDLYFHAYKGSYYSYFHQYDLTSDSLISSEYITHITGSIAVSPDGKRVYMTNGGNAMVGEYPIHPIWIFDALTHQPIYWIPPYDSSGWIYPFFGQIIPTPDNRRIYICGNIGGVPVTVVDLQENRIINTVNPYLNSASTIIALGPVPED